MYKDLKINMKKSTKKRKPKKHWLMIKKYDKILILFLKKCFKKNLYHYIYRVISIIKL